MANSVPSTPLFPPISGGGCYPPPPPPLDGDYGCPVPGCPVPGTKPPHRPPCPPPPPYPDPHEPGYWAKDGDWPLPPESPSCPPPPPPKCPPNHSTVVPPPIPPVRYVPGMDVQEQLTTMANHVNVCVDRWNQIQANCYDALNKVVGAAVSNDVYYEPDEVRFSTGYSSADGSTYEIIESKAVDKAGRPIHLSLQTAFNGGNKGVRQSILDKSFVSSGNAVITAVSPALGTDGWRGLCMVHGNPVATAEPQEGDWLCGWTKRGVLRLLPATETTVESACRNQIVDCIGPVIPIVMNGKPTVVAANYPAEPGAIQAIGWKQCNGNKVLFSCGMQDEPGCTVKNVADLLVSMGVTTAAITCYMNAYGTGNMGPFVKENNGDDNSGESNPSVGDSVASSLAGQASVTNVVGQAQNVYGNNGIVPEPWVNQEDSLQSQEVLGLTGGMTYIGKLSDRPLQYQIPQNAAFWIITKRPIRAGWPNRWTGEIADICQRLGMNATELDSVQGKLDIEQVQILDLQNRVGKLETNDKEQDAQIADHETRINDIEDRLDSAEGDIQQLFTDLSAETAARIAGDEKLAEDLQKEIDARTDGDNKLNDRVNQLRTALTEEITARNQADQDLSNAILNEVNARIAGDTQLSTKIDLNKVQLENLITKEQTAREEADDNLQEQIDALGKDVSKINLKTGHGLREVVSSNGTRTIEAYLGPGMRFNPLGQITPNIGNGLQIIDGQIIPKLSECFTINEEGEITMSCCCDSNGKLPMAGEGLDYTVDPQSGEVSMNLVPPTGSDLGGVKAGNGVTIEADGTINVNGGGGNDPYTLPPATKTTLGGVVIGDNLTVDENGKVSAVDSYVLPVASPTVLGGVKVGKNLVIDAAGILNAEIPDLPAGEGDTVLSGDGINIVKDGTQRTATISLSDETKGTLAQVGDNKNAIDALDSKVDNVAKGTVSNTLFQTTVQGINQNVTKAQGAADAAQVTANQANAAANDAAELAAQAKETADNAAAAFVNALPLSGGTMTGDINFEQQSQTRSVEGAPTIKGLPTPTEPDEVANKKYVDDAVSGADTSGLMPKSGGTFSGNVTMGSGAKLNGITEPTAESEAANKGYVDSLKPEIQAAQNAADAAATKADSAASTAATASQQSTQALAKADEAKAAADAASVAVEGGPFLPLSGGSMTGDIDINANINLNGTDSSNNYKVNIADNRATNRVVTLDRTGLSIDNVGNSTSKCSYGVNGAFIAQVTDDSTVPHLSLSKSNGVVGFSATSHLNPSSGVAIIGGVADPDGDYAAANKRYVDNAVAGASSGAFLPLTGGTVTGDVIFNKHLTVGTNKKTIINDGDITSSFTTNSGVTESVDLHYSSFNFRNQGHIWVMQGIKGSNSSSVNFHPGTDTSRSTTPTILRGVSSPVIDDDAANKKYVDDAVAGVSGSVGAFLPLTGGTVTGTLTVNNLLNIGTGGYTNSVRPHSITIAGEQSSGDETSVEYGYGSVYFRNQGNVLFIAGTNSAGNTTLVVKPVSESTSSTSATIIRGVKNPVQSYDAANKSYVDSKVIESVIKQSMLAFGNNSYLDSNWTCSSSAGNLYLVHTSFNGKNKVQLFGSGIALTVTSVNGISSSDTTEIFNWTQSNSSSITNRSIPVGYLFANNGNIIRPLNLRITSSNIILNCASALTANITAGMNCQLFIQGGAIMT